MTQQPIRQGSSGASHGAIVAREYGIPAVLNVPLATHRIPDGSALVLDGGAGMVWLEEGGNAEARER